MAKVCAVCGGNAVALYRRKIANEGVVCDGCFREALLTPKQFLGIKKLTSDDFLKAMTGLGKNKEDLKINATKKIGVAVYFDDEKEQLLIPTPAKSYLFNYSEIISFELLEDGETITSGGLGRSLVGGALFGETGAVVGAVTGKKKNIAYCTNLKVKLTVNDTAQPAVYITFLNKKIKTDSTTYRIAYNHVQECISMLQLICNREQNKKNTQTSETDKILEYKKLLDQGVITEEEFALKKKELLGL
ncbi:hypothetical protein J6TS1_08600 [Siminovitchia terrae]|nr:SHOCT domain-containing protein [Siminovitchia terrae]GIN94990.1 hypothetical protein J6TS1_08600 [Siminovitchia terrae]